MNSILREVSKLPKFNDYIENIKQKQSPILLSGLSDVGKIELIEATKEYSKKPICLITYNEIEAKKLVEDLKFFSRDIVYFPKKELVTYDYIAESKNLPYERIEALNKLYKNEAKIIVTTIEAVMQRLPPKEILYKNILKFKIGQNYNIEEIKKKLVNLGYERYDLIEGKGQFSVRGDIIDISESENIGIRIEFWGDEIDSIRRFAISSQRSIENVEEVEIYPAHEYILELNIENTCEKIESRIYTDNQEENVKEDIELIKSGNYISKIDKYFDDFYEKSVNILEYLEKDAIIIIDDISKIQTRANNIIKDTENLERVLAEKEKIIPQAISNILNFEEIQIIIERFQKIFLEEQDINFKLQAIRFGFNYRNVNFYKSGIEIFFEEVKKAKENNKKVFILAGTEEKAKKVSKMLLEKEIINEYKENIKSEIGLEAKIIVTKGILSSGYECYDTNVMVIVANELVESEKKKRRFSHSSFKEGEKIVFADLKIGDYVVHKTHGIGRFIGVNTIKADGITKDYIKIHYKGEDILYVPTNQLDNIRKYIGGGESEPRINKLGSKEWNNTKEKVKKNLREVARELIELYAKRQKVRGYSFSKDTPWQQEFENSFPYQETEDQLRSIEEVKKDMEKEKPMDRLLCGDVGYGKTEVAIRAAFKAVMDQKQVAYLAPTTVLAHQQYEEFKQRMEQFPIRVELLNRFKTKKEQTQILKKLELGEIDVLIGTHRILSKDVKFKDLGLLIIDEEHRFGVKDKEKIKEYKTNVDVLTMTATPIPRTLHMSIVGVRDMSCLYEPPQNRKAVQTYVLEYDKEVIKEAIIKEIERNGQVFYLFNNVEKILQKANEIAELVLEAKVAFAHGKMTGNEMELIMKEFINREYNVLVCTTILESGIDIPNANTIIVENADRLGLAQLYQIRGRVGRSDRQAYAYITYKRDKLLTEIADKRLKAIKEFTEFGSGFRIAMRDLEIRGAGSLLRRSSTWTLGTSRI